MRIKAVPRQVARYFVDLKSWLEVRKDKKDLHCAECKKSFVSLNESHVGLVLFVGHPNAACCKSCCEKFIAEGGEDMDKKREEHAKRKSELQTKIKELGYNKPLSDKIDELEAILLFLEKKREEERILAENVKTYVETYTEPYLKDDYNLVEFKDLKHHSQIKEHFMSLESAVYFDCGRGYSQDEANLILKIGDKFYDVNLEAEIGSQRMDIGDRIYYVESITNVDYKEIPKPAPKERKDRVIHINCTDEKYNQILKFISNVL